MELVRNPKGWSAFLENNGYVLHTCVGRGSFGDVYAVTKTSTGARWAIKRLLARKDIAEDENFQAEVRALMALDHDNIVHLSEVMMCPKLACLVMELAPMGSLEILAARARDKIGTTFIQTSFRQLLSAVDYCHGLEIAHRDINPSNVLVFSDTLVKLADFGLCFRCDDVVNGDLILCSDYLGQEAYLAPEVKARQPYSAKPADVWSIGCVLYFLATITSPPGNANDLLVKISEFESSDALPYGNHYRKILRQIFVVDVPLRPTVSAVKGQWPVSLESTDSGECIT